MPKAGYSFSFVLLLVAFVATPQIRAQATPEASPEHLQQIQTCRDGILDESARPQDRKRWVEMLFSYATPQADALFVTLLNLRDRPKVLIAVCEVLAIRGAQNRARLSPAFVEPLLKTLSSKNGELRSAAGAALAEFPSDQVADQLGELAADPDAPMVARLAAIDALAPNTHRREVVKQLIALLDQSVPEITERVVAALSPIAPNGFGANVERWHLWWATKSGLSNEAWLAEQLKHYRSRARKTAAKLASVEQDLAKQQASLATRIRDFQREVLRPLTEEQKQAKLAEWMDDPLTEVKQGAVALVRSRIADEGKRPTGDVLAALLRLLDHDSPTIRRDVLTIAQNVREKSVTRAVLARLDRETDASLRQAIFHALGMLASQEAIPVLLREIRDDSKPPASVIVAAQALGRIASNRPNNVDMAPAIEPLKNRYAKTNVKNVDLRAALLTAMAGVADASFAGEFLNALESDRPEILQPALQGIKLLGDASKLPRVRSLVGHNDPRIRLAAVDAVGSLGRENADLESIFSHLNPAQESDEAVRQAAWKSFRQFLSRRPMEERIAAARRLREWPDLETQYTEQLANVLATAGEYNENLETLRDRLAILAIKAGKYEEAIPHLRELYAMRFGHQDPRAVDDGIRWINAVLKSPEMQNLSQVVVRVGEGSSDPSIRNRVVDAIRDYVEATDLTVDTKRSARLLIELRSVNKELFGDAWTKLLAEIEAKSKPPTPAQTPSPGP